MCADITVNTTADGTSVVIEEVGISGPTGPTGLKGDAGASTVEAGVYAAEALASAQAAAASEAGALGSEAQAAIEAAAAASSETATGADALATAADRVQTGLDAAATAADALSTGSDVIVTTANLAATNQDTLDTEADATATAADRVQTGLDAVATAADRVQTGLDAAATASDLAQTTIDAGATAADAIATAANLAATNQDTLDTAADLVQTGLDAAATAADVVSIAGSEAATAADVISTNADAAIAAGAVAQTTADAATAAQASIDTAADLALTNADVVSTSADVVTTTANVSSASTSAAAAAASVSDAAIVAAASVSDAVAAAALVNGFVTPVNAEILWPLRLTSIPDGWYDTTERLLSGTATRAILSNDVAYIYVANSILPKTILDMQNERYAKAGTVGDKFSDIVTQTRTSLATMTDSDGLLKWGPHNFQFQSDDISETVVAWKYTSATNIDANTWQSTGTGQRLETKSGSQVVPAVNATYTVAFRLWAARPEDVGKSFSTAVSMSGQANTVGSTTLVPEEPTLFTLQSDVITTATSLALFITSESAGTVQYKTDNLRIYRSDLGGMAPVPLADRVAGSETYVPTTTAAVYLPRRNHKVYDPTTAAWNAHNYLPYSETFVDNYIPSTGGTSTPTTLANGLGGYVMSASTAREFYQVFTGDLPAGTYTFEVYVDSFSGSLSRPFAYLTMASAGSAMYKSDVVDGKATKTFTWAGGEIGPLRVGVGTDSNDSGSIALGGLHLYRSDLNGVVANSGNAVSGLYVPTTATAVPATLNTAASWPINGYRHESAAATNLITQSQDYTQWTAASGATFTAAGSNPLGLPNWGVLNLLNTSSARGYPAVASIANGDTVCGSAYIDANQSDDFQFEFVVGTPGSERVRVFCTIGGTTLTTVPASVGGTGIDLAHEFDPVEVSAGIWRLSLAVTNSSGVAKDYTVSIWELNEIGDVAFNGVQLEAGSKPTSYIPTAGSTVVRAADVATIPIANVTYPTRTEVTGIELVTNGDFGDGTTGWVVNIGDEILSVVDGRLRVTYGPDGVTGTGPGAQQEITGLTVGAMYLLSVGTILKGTNGAAGVRPLQGTSNGIPGVASLYGFSDQSNVSLAFIATMTTHNINVYGGYGTAGTYVEADNISLKEVKPLTVSFGMKGLMTYAYADVGVVGDGVGGAVVPFTWTLDASNYIYAAMSTSFSQVDTGRMLFVQEVAAGLALVNTGKTYYSPGINVPFSIASRHGETFINAALDGTALTETTPLGFPDLSTTDILLAPIFNGVIQEFIMWVGDEGDISDAGMEETSA